MLDIDLDTIIPPYIVDANVLNYLACLPGPQPDSVIIGPVLPPGGLPLVPYGDSDDDGDFYLKEMQGPLKETPRKRRSRKIKEPLDAKFLRCSQRNNVDLGGFRNAESTQAAANNPSIYATPLAVLPPVYHGSADGGSQAPHLPLEIIQGIATEYLQMQPSAVSAASIFELDDDDSDM